MSAQSVALGRPDRFALESQGRGLPLSAAGSAHESPGPGSPARTRGAAARPSAAEVESRLLDALGRMDAARKDAVSWFGEIVERRLHLEFGHSSIQQYARERLGFSASKTSEFLKLWHSFRELPELRAAVDSGDVPWTLAREVIKVATPQTVSIWVREASTLTRRDLQRKVEAVRCAARRRRRFPGQAEMSLGEADGSPDTAEARGAAASIRRPDVLEVPVGLSLTLSPEQYARYEALMEAARKNGARGSREDLVLAGLELLATGGEASARSQGQGLVSGRVRETGAAGGVVERPAATPHSSRASRSEPRYRIVMHLCERCGEAEFPTSRGNLQVGASTLAAAICDARIQRPGERTRATVPPSVRRQVLARDGHRCRSAGCASRRFLDVHHITPRSAGGSNDPSNLITLCSGCHRLVHEMEERAGFQGLRREPGDLGVRFRPGERDISPASRKGHGRGREQARD